MHQSTTPAVVPNVIVTGASSGVGLHATQSLTERGWFVVMACRDTAKAARVAQELGIPASHHAVLEIDLGAQASVRPKASRSAWPPTTWATFCSAGKGWRPASKPPWP